MAYAKRIVLHCRRGYDPRLDALVEDFIRDGVGLVAVLGEDCSRVEDIVDELVVGDGERDYKLLTTSHPDESLEEVVYFARYLDVPDAGPEVQIVEL